MKLISKITLLAGISATALCFVSCDSAPNSDVQQAADISLIPNVTAQSLEFVAPGDTIRLTTTVGEEIVEGDIIASSLTQFATTNQVPFDYRKIDTNEFSLIGEVDSLTNLTTALSSSLGDPGVLNSELRDILLAKTYARGDLQRVVDILSVLGVDLILHPTENSILAVQNSEYFFRVESNNASLLDGNMSGIFNSQITYARLKFRPATAGQIAAVRLITPSHDIPFLDINDTLVLSDTQGGIFTLTLENQASNVAQNL